MKDKIKLALAQLLVKDGDFDANLQRGLDALEEAAKRGAELCCLPELWTTGYDLKRAKAYAEKNRLALDAVSELCARRSIWCVAGSFILNGEKGLENAAVVFDDQGSAVARYPKMHLFPALGEDKVFESGIFPTFFQSPWGPFGVAICYDLRFAELFRRYFDRGVTIVFLPSQWPNPRYEHWKLLARARSLENNCFLAACNIAGRPEEDKLFGASLITDPWGEAVLEWGQQPELRVAELDLSYIKECDEKLHLRDSAHPFFR